MQEKLAACARRVLERGKAHEKRVRKKGEALQKGNAQEIQREKAHGEGQRNGGRKHKERGREMEGESKHQGVKRVKNKVVRKSVRAQEGKCERNPGVRKGEGMRKYPFMQERVRCEKGSVHKIE